jgi:hypothetical protein
VAPFSMSSVVGHLVVHDDKGQRATLTRESRITANYKFLDEISFRHISADGPVDNIRWNGSPVDATQIKELPGGEHEVIIKFPGPLERGKEFTGTISFDCIDAFRGNPEMLSYLVDRPTKEVTLRVGLPAGRPCKRAYSYKILGAHKENSKEPTVSSTTIELVIKNAEFGSTYEVRWDC